MKYARLIFITLTVTLVGAFTVGIATSRFAAAQTFIQPPAAPPGGNSAGWITTGTTVERKLGPLLIGSSITNSSLCLNADVSEVTNPATTKCISSWGQVVNLAGGPFVPLRTSGLAAINQSDPTQYFTTPSATNLGVSSIQASGANQFYSLIAEANLGTIATPLAAGYGLFAGDGGVPSNVAAQFAGRVGIGATILGSGAPGTAGKLCLNSTSLLNDNANPNKGVLGCITTWGELDPGPLTGYVTLQTANPPIPDAGTAAASEVGNFATAVFGHPPVGQPAQTFCGDGMCSTHINENVGGATPDPNYCPIDCSAPNQPSNLSVFSATNTIVNLQLTLQAQIPAGLVRLLLVRSTNPTFSLDLKSGFIPQNGVVYFDGQVINGVTVVLSMPRFPGGFSYFDNVPAANVTYYYRLYQANMFPIYNLAPLTTQATPI